MHTLYTGTAGRIEIAQVGAYLGSAPAAGHALNLAVVRRVLQLQAETGRLPAEIERLKAIDRSQPSRRASATDLARPE